MTCQECQIELFADDAGRDALLHLGECEECQALAREIQANAEALAALRGEELAARPFVHARGFPWVWGAAAAAVLLVALGWPRSEAPGRAQPEPAKPLEVAAAVEVTTPAPKITKRTRAAARPAGKARPKAESVLPVEEPVQPLLVKMLTPDPDVVIYWLIEGDKSL
jgi:hypothetical protein